MDDDQASVRSFYERYHMNYPVAMGDDALADRFGGIVGLPTTFIIDRDGRIFAKQTGAADIDAFAEAIKELLGRTATASK
jgi:peroxiredoxin